MGRGTLQGRFFLAVASLLALVLAGAAIYGRARIRRFHRGEVEIRLDTAAELLRPRAAAAFAGEDPGAGLVEAVRALGAASGLRITLVAPDGTVLADSDAALPIESHGDRPEIVEARETGRGVHVRRSATTGIETLYVAHRIGGPGPAAGFVRTAAPLERIDAEVAALDRALLLGGGAALAAGLALSWFLARRLATPLAEMERTAAAFAGGDLEGRVRVRGPGEIGSLADSLNRMAEELRGRIETARRERDRLEAILRSMVEGVVAVDAGERIVLMNDAAARLLGLARTPVPGASLWEALRFPQLETALREALATGAAWSGDAPSPSGSGRILALSVQGVDGRRGALALLRDVTEVRRLETMRKDFVANVSHELRTPLAAVRGAVDTIADAGAEEEAARARFLEIARRNVERLQAIVSDLLDLSSIEAEGEAVDVETISVEGPLRRAVEAVGEAAAKKGIALEVAPGPTLPIAANARRLEQAFVNLLENAIKYSPPGGRVTARSGVQGEEVLVEIEDTGVGIPAASLPRIFERFYRVDRARSREMGGTGLGLAIVKHVVQAHRGRVEVRSEEGRGSIFSVYLPSARPRAGNSQAGRPGAREKTTGS
ncbi:MAG: ATP-binding protein [Planctomycetes bacterium]|nr:ATP-binding protein [Planctomycetota bacterium]